LTSGAGGRAFSSRSRTSSTRRPDGHRTDGSSPWRGSRCEAPQVSSWWIRVRGTSLVLSAVRTRLATPSGRQTADDSVCDGSRRPFQPPCCRTRRASGPPGARPDGDVAGHQAAWRRNTSDVSPDGRTIAFVGYTPDGFDLFAIPFDRSAWLPVDSGDWPAARPSPPDEPGTDALLRPATALTGATARSGLSARITGRRSSRSARMKSGPHHDRRDGRARASRLLRFGSLADPALQWSLFSRPS